MTGILNSYSLKSSIRKTKPKTLSLLSTLFCIHTWTSSLYTDQKDYQNSYVILRDNSQEGREKARTSDSKNSLEHHTTQYRLCNSTSPTGWKIVHISLMGLFNIGNYPGEIPGTPVIITDMKACFFQLENGLNSKNAHRSICYCVNVHTKHIHARTKPSCQKASRITTTKMILQVVK